MNETKSYGFVFLRHGESVGNAEERFQGQSDYPLTDMGRQQAQRLAERWVRDRIRLDLVITSPLGRAQETAASPFLIAGTVAPRITTALSSPP